MRLCLKMLYQNEETTKLLKCIIQSGNYLKARYKMHCKVNDSCISHCVNHALSHPQDKELLSTCDRPHDRICLECQNIINSIASLKSMINRLPQSHEKDVAVWEVRDAEVKIIEWQKHIMRGVHQSKARAEAFKELGPTNAVWIRDYAEKVLPAKVFSTHI